MTGEHWQERFDEEQDRSNRLGERVRDLYDQLQKAQAGVKRFGALYFEMKREAGIAAASDHCFEFAVKSDLLPVGEGEEFRGMEERGAQLLRDEEGPNAL